MVLKRNKKEKQLQDFRDKFDSRTRKEGDCLVWTMGRTPFGYGHMHSNRYAHRVSYEAFKGSIGEKMVVRHICDNPPCISPKHLVLGTQADNVKDRTERVLSKYYKSLHRPQDKLKYGYHGIAYEKRIKGNKKWGARLKKDGKLYHDYYYSTVEEAARAYNRLALKLYGEFAVLNEFK